MRSLAVLLLAVLCQPLMVLADSPRIVIIIDDIGYRPSADRRVLKLPIEVALAVLPSSPNAAAMAMAGHSQGRPVMVHLPMQSLDDRSNAALLGPEALTLDTTEAELKTILSDAFAAVPHAEGVNNHMGSLLTQHPGHMRWLMQALACRKASFFIDSFTSADSVALDTAIAEHLPATRRHVFLDSDPNFDAIVAELERLIALARRDGYAVAIGHPLPETLRAIEELLPVLNERGVRLVTPSALFASVERDTDPELSQLTW